MRTDCRPEHERFQPTTRPRILPLPTAPDVVVIDAGAAGIAAARALAAAGLSAAMIEARGRVGGRALTTLLRSRPVDFGAHWLHAGPINPLVALGQERGKPLRRAPQDGHLVVGRRSRAFERMALVRIRPRRSGDHPHHGGRRRRPRVCRDTA